MQPVMSPAKVSFMRHRCLLLMILLLACALRFYRLEAQSLWYDEAVTAQVVQQGLAELTRWTADDIQPPLYYALLAGWTRLAGSSEWALRFPSAAFGLLLVVLAYITARRLFGPSAGLLAMLLAAVHPQWVYYSQEARMYTMLTALGLLTGYALLRVRAGRNAGHLAWWLALIVTAVALLYTHYFAAFLLLALALYYLLGVLSFRASSSPAPSRYRALAPGLLAALVALLAYLPWLPNALRRLRMDASYWRGTLKLHEALRHVVISFTTGETMLEVQAVPLAWGMMGLTGLSLLALLGAVLARRGERGNGKQDKGLPPVPYPLSAILYPILYLAVPLVSILVLSYRTPKFNPRYLMLASPGLILLLAGGLSLPFTWPGRLRSSASAPTPTHPTLPTAYSTSRVTGYRLRIPALTHIILRLLTLLALAFLLVVYLTADHNWFVDPAFTKDDWRSAVAYVRSHLQPDEAVILVSGHALSAWRYYAADVEPVRLPKIDILDVNAVLDLPSAAAALNAGLANTQGAWLVQWQQEVVDPTGVVPFLLQVAGSEEPVKASFWGLGRIRHFRWPASTIFPTQPPLAQALNANFANQVELLGFTQPSCASSPLPSAPPSTACPLYLFWRGYTTLDSDLKLSAILLDDVGHAWSRPMDRRLSAYTYPTFRWQPGRPVLSRLQLRPDLGTPPGRYRLRLNVYDADTGQVLSLLDASGAVQGPWAWLQPIVVPALVTEGPGGPPAAGPSLAAAAEIRLLALRSNPAEAEPGDRIGVEAWWLSERQPTRDYLLRWQWLTADGRTFSAGQLPPAGAAFPTGQWPANSTVRSQFDVRVPVGATPGTWQLRVGLQDPLGGEGFAGEAATLAVRVLPGSRSFQPPAVQQRVGARFEGLIELLGISRDPSGPVAAGSSVTITVAWHALAQVDISYTGFVHLLDPSGSLVAQDDHLPQQGRHPTVDWVPGEYVVDRYRLDLPPDLPPGDYTIETGLYDAGQPGLPRLGQAVMVGRLSVSSASDHDE